MPKKTTFTKNRALNKKLEKLERNYNKSKQKHKPKLESYDKYHESIQTDLKRIDLLPEDKPVIACPF